jgi:hypothetical protein
LRIVVFRGIRATVDQVAARGASLAGRPVFIVAILEFAGAANRTQGRAVTKLFASRACEADFDVRLCI